MQSGLEQRKKILLQSVERSIIEPLKKHGWEIIDQSFTQAGEYVIVEAERAEKRHKVAVIYSSATENAVYKRLAGLVEYIFLNGEPYHLESYAYGIDVPVGTLTEFHSLLLQWNAESSPGKFAPGPETELAARPQTQRTLLAESPIDAIWLRLRQLGSVTLSRKLLQARAANAGVEIPPMALNGKAEGLAYALRNATDYFQTKERTNVSQRVLNLYYGTLAFAFADMLAAPNGVHTLAEIENSTKQGHGLYTIDGESDGLEQMVVGPLASGFLPAWVRTLALGDAAWPTKKPRRFEDLSTFPAGTWLTLEQLFSRIPEVSDLFTDIFDSKPSWVVPAYDSATNHVPGLFGSSEKPSTSYVLLMDQSGRLTREDIAGFPGPISQISPVEATSAGRCFRAAVDHEGHSHWAMPLAVHSSPFTNAAIVMPTFGVQEYRVSCLILLYALSIIVRYRPSIWRRVQEGDLDHLRVLIEAFLSVVERVLPEQFLEAVTGTPVFAKQPTSFL